MELIIATIVEDEEICVQEGSVSINNLHFTDDAAVFAGSPSELQAMVSRAVEVR